MDDKINQKVHDTGHLNKVCGFSLGNMVHSGGNILKKHNMDGSGPIRRSEFWKLYELEHIELEFLFLVSAIIDEAFSNSNWYMTLKDKMKLIPGNRFVKGRTVPISHIWWTRFASKKNFHTDNKVLGSVFIFCTKRYKGGDLIVGTPAKYGHVIPLDPGKIVAGRFSEYSHGTTESEENRHSIVCYLDYRVLCPNYKYVANDD